MEMTTKPTTPTKRLLHRLNSEQSKESDLHKYQDLKAAVEKFL